MERAAGTAMPGIAEKMRQLSTAGRFILLLAGARQFRPIPGKTHLQKEMYLLQRTFPELGDEAGYEPRSAGPYSDAVDDEAGRLELAGLIGLDGGRFELTREGRAAFDRLKIEMDKELDGVQDLKELLNDLTRDEIAALVYFSQPEEDLEDESAIYADLELKRERLAMSMYRKEKISAQRAAQIAGMYLGDFIDRIKADKNPRRGSAGCPGSPTL